MDRRRALGLALLALAIVATGAMLALNPLPKDHEQWLCCEGEGGVLMVARGPAASRYDAGTDTTIAVFRCGDGACTVATQIAGNATAQVARATTMLFSIEGTPAPDVVDLPQPIEVAGGNVTSMTAARFEIGRAWLPLLLYQLVFLAGVVGGLFAFRASELSVVAGALGAGVGMLVGAQFAAAGPDATVGALVLMGVAAAAAFVVRRVFPHSPPARYAVPFLLAFALAIVFSELVTIRYFAHAPSG